MKENNKYILFCLINEFIKYNKPVSSKSLCENYNIQLSSSSVRNILKKLESKGYLVSKHVSGGKIPTSLSYRLYIDSLSYIGNLTVEEKQKIQSVYLQKTPTLEHILKSTSEILSSVSNQASFVVGFKSSVQTIKHIELIHVTEQEILMIIVMRSGNVLNKKIYTENNYYQYQLYELSKYLNQRLKGYNLKDFTNEIFPKLKKEDFIKETFLPLLNSIERNIKFENSDETDIYVDGRRNFLNKLYDNEIDVLDRIFKLLDDKVNLKNFVYRYLEINGCYSILGDIDDDLIKGLSIIISSYQIGDQKVGSLGVIGPQRMNYSKNFPLVDFTSNLVSTMLTKISN